MGEILTIILKVVMCACVGAVTIKAASYVRTVEKRERYGQLMDVIETVVMAAEQMGKQLNGDEKMTWASVKLSEWLDRRSIKVSASDLNVMLEAAVYAMKQARGGGTGWRQRDKKISS